MVLVWKHLTPCTETSTCIVSILFTMHFLRCLQGEFVLTVKDFFTCWSMPLFLWPKYVIQRWYCKEKLDASHSWGTGFIIMPFLKHLWFFLNPNNSVYILHTVLYAFPKVLVGRIKQFRAFLVTYHFLNSCDLNVWFRGGIVRRC